MFDNLTRSSFPAKAMRFWGGGEGGSREANAAEKPPLLGGVRSYQTIEDGDSTVGPKKPRALSDDVTAGIEEEDAAEF